MKKTQLHLRSRSRAVALEPRLLFDGAGAVATVDALPDAPAPDFVDPASDAEGAPAEGEEGAADDPLKALQDSLDKDGNKKP